MEKDRAIVIRRIRFSDSSLICVWLCRDHGKVKTSARAALRPGSPFAGKLDLFYEADMAFQKGRGEVQALREVALVQPFDGMGTRYANLAMAAYFAELVDRATEPAAPAREIFELLERATGYLRREPAAARGLLHFESELCRALGISDRPDRNDPLQALATHCGRIPAQRERALRACAEPLAEGPRNDKLA